MNFMITLYSKRKPADDIHTWKSYVIDIAPKNCSRFSLNYLCNRKVCRVLPQPEQQTGPSTNRSYSNDVMIESDVSKLMSIYIADSLIIWFSKGAYFFRVSFHCPSQLKDEFLNNSSRFVEVERSDTENYCISEVGIQGDVR